LINGIAKPIKGRINELIHSQHTSGQDRNTDTVGSGDIFTSPSGSRDCLTCFHRNTFRLNARPAQPILWQRHLRG